MTQQTVSQIDSLIIQLEELREKFETGMVSRKNFIEMKLVFLQMKELSRLIKELPVQQDGQLSWFSRTSFPLRGF